MKVVIALDKFKGSLTATEACACVRRGLLAVRSDLTIVVKPMADGGEGTARALIAALDGAWIPATVKGPLPDQSVPAGYGWFAKQNGAVIEMAAASGLAQLKPTDFDPLRTTTFGTGQLIELASERGVARLWLGVGGSATNDGGVGAAMALGWKFLDANDRPVGHGGGELERITRIIAPTNLRLPKVEVLCDVDNPLCGEHGSAHVFGPQKGATPAMVARLDDGLRHLATLVREQLGKDVLNVPGAGAAGGLAAGALAFMNAKLVPGIETIIQFTGLDAALADADWVITGEGCFDEQSLRGKVVSGVTALARRTGTQVAVLAGRVALDEARWRACGVAVASSLMRDEITLDHAQANAGTLLAERAEEFATSNL